MIHAAVARAGGHPEFGKLLHEKNILPALGDGAADGAADDATTNDQNVGLVHKAEIGDQNLEDGKLLLKIL